jgi:hypothetical protein
MPRMSVSRRSATPTTTTMLTMSGSMNNLTATRTGTLSSYGTRENNSVAGTSNLSIPSATSAGPLYLDFKLGLPPGNAAAVDGRKAATLAVPSARRHSNPEPQSRLESLPILQDESVCDLSYLTEFQSNSQSDLQ